MHASIFASVAIVLASASVACSGVSSNAASDGGITGNGPGSDAAQTQPQDAAGPGHDATVPPPGSPLPCDVQPIIATGCQACHGSSTSGGAPMPLVSWEDFHAVLPWNKGTEEYKIVETRIHAAHNPMPPAPGAPLAAADLSTIDAWVAAGAPAGTGTCGTDASVPIPDAAPPPLECTSDDLTIAPASAWSMPQADNDDYVCFGYDAPAGSIPAGTTRHVLGMTPKVDNHKIVHHVLLYQADTSYSPTPAVCNPGGSLGWRVVYGWAPGGGAMKTPPDVGFPYDGTTHWVVQVHYNNIGHLTGQTDSTGFSMCTTAAPVKYDADVMAFGTMSISIPALSKLDQTCSLTVPAELSGAHLFSAFPHMHQLGVGIETEQVMPGGGIVDLGRNDPWSFNQQVWFPINATLEAGDVVRTRCAWQNSTSNAVGFGPTTEDEMCYSFTGYYPRVPSSSWSWATPAEQTSCATTPSGGLPTPDGGWVIPDGGVGSTPVDAGGD